MTVQRTGCTPGGESTLKTGCEGKSAGDETKPKKTPVCAEYVVTG